LTFLLCSCQGSKHLVKRSASADWSYDDTDAWEDLSGSQCSGRRQSPIRIDPETKDDPKLKKLHFHDYSTAFKAKIKYNAAHKSFNIVFKPRSGDKLPTISGGKLKDRYVFAQLHLHWGVVDNRHHATEHQLGDRKYAGELHLVHYNTKYKDIAEAVEEKDGIAVLAFFLHRSSCHQENRAWAPILSSLDSVAGSRDDEEVKIGKLKLSDLLPSPKPKNYYLYRGSLTTPMCNEVVQWYVHDRSIQFSEAQLLKLNEVDDTDRFRPVQPLHGRKVRAHLEEPYSGE